MPKRNYRRKSYDKRKSNTIGNKIKMLCVIIILAGVGIVWKTNWADAYVPEWVIEWRDTWNQLPETVEDQKSSDIGETTIKPVAPSMGMLRANAAKLIAYTFYNTDEIEQLEREIEIEDTLPSFWYDKYINAVIQLGYMKSINNKFYPTESVTYAEMAHILTQISKNQYNIQIKGEEEIKDKKISMQQFIRLYTELLKKLSPQDSMKHPYEIQETNIIVLATPANDERLGAWRVATDQGEYGFEGLSLDGYIDKQIKVLVKNNEILGIIEVISTNPIFESAYISKVENGQVEVMIGGVVKIYDTDILNETYNDTLVDLHFKNGKIVGADIKKEEYKDRVLRITDDYIEMERYGVIPFAEGVKIYDRTEDGIKWSKPGNIIVGTEDIEYAMEDGKIHMITIKNKPTMKKIRVLLTTSNFQEKLHKEVKITSTESFVVDFYGERKNYKADEVMDISEWTKKMTEQKPRIRIIPSKGAKLQVATIERRGENPAYCGTLEVSKEKNGQYALVNEVSIEDYVAAVIPSEMPTSYGIEACKVQAITARSYAYVHASNNRYRDYGATLDDSTNSQVYNNVPADDIALRAAQETAGKVLQYNGQVISANCFATSSGYTANFGEVWAHTDGTFPANTPAYLVSSQQYVGDKIANDMTSEKEAYQFFTTSGASMDAYDNQSPWFRWKLTMQADEITESVNATLARRYNANPSLIKTLGKDRVFRPKEIEDIGVVEKIQVHKRGQGGNIMELILYGSKHTIKVSTEYNIRTLLSPLQRIEGRDPIVIKRQDGSEIKNFEMLPSAFFAIDAKYDKNEKLISVTFYGGGFGHGVGMSQDGVRGMVQKGHTYQDILVHYYPGARVGSV